MIFKSAALITVLASVVALNVGFSRLLASPSVPEANLKLSRAQQKTAVTQQKSFTDLLNKNERPKIPFSALHFTRRVEDLPRASEPALLHPPLQPGDLAPDFNLRDQTGKLHRLSSLRGKRVVISFYPEDFSYACASSAVDLNDKEDQIKARGAVIFGVSVQNFESKQRFAREFHLEIPLLADESKDVARSYRVLNPYGEAARVTFLIGPDGRIEDTDQDVHVATHGSDVLASLDAPRRF